MWSVMMAGSQKGWERRAGRKRNGQQIYFPSRQRKGLLSLPTSPMGLMQMHTYMGKSVQDRSSSTNQESTCIQYLNLIAAAFALGMRQASFQLYQPPMPELDFRAQTCQKWTGRKRGNNNISHHHAPHQCPFHTLMPSTSHTCPVMPHMHKLQTHCTASSASAASCQPPQQQQHRLSHSLPPYANAATPLAGRQ